MTDDVMLDWRVPSTEWQRFRDYVHDEHGSLDGHLGHEAEAAMQEYADLDDYAAVEEKVKQLVEAAGRRPEPAFKEKISSLADQETDRVTVRVDEDVKAEFREIASDADHPFGVIFARAIRAYREGGRADRVGRQLDRILDDAERLLGELKPEEDADELESSESLSLVERKTIAICDELGDQFTDDELVDTIERVAEASSDPSIRKYRGRVVDRLEMERHPNAPHLWVPEEMADEIADGEPRVIRQPVDRLDRDERIRRIRLAIGRAAAERDSGELRVQTPVVQEEILDGDVTRATTLSLMRSATLSSGAGIGLDDDTSPAALEVDLELLGEVDRDLASEIFVYRDKTDEGLLTSPTSTTVTDYLDPKGMPPENARAFSDGGTTHRFNEWTGKPRLLREEESEDGDADD